jgi:hypothetical protein
MFRSTGFDVGAAGDWNANGESYIYMAIRRPNKPPTVGTEVFSAVLGRGGVTYAPKYLTDFTPDWVWERQYDISANWDSAARLVPEKSIRLNYSYGENNESEFSFDYQNGWWDNTYSETTDISWMFRRAPGFFDVVAYSGTGSNKTENHNLASTPEFIFVKRRSSTEDWTCYHSSLGNTKYIQLNGTSAAGTLSNGWNNTDPTSTNFTVGTHARVNTSGQTYLAFLFATLPGISKVGSYTGSSSTINVDCGFTNGARFVLIKRTDSIGNWQLFDSTRGIVSGDDPNIYLNASQAQKTDENHIGPLNAGFTVNAAAGEADTNATGGTYLFLAIA